jgi:hypothetical protein
MLVSSSNVFFPRFKITQGALRTFVYFIFLLIRPNRVSRVVNLKKHTCVDCVLTSASPAFSVASLDNKQSRSFTVPQLWDKDMKFFVCSNCDKFEPFFSFQLDSSLLGGVESMQMAVLFLVVFVW